MQCQPAEEYLQNPVHHLTLDRRSRQRGIIDPSAVDRMLRDHAAGVSDDGDRIWSLMNLELWYRTFVDGEGVQTLPEPRAKRRRPGLGVPVSAHTGAIAGGRRNEATA